MAGIVPTMLWEAADAAAALRGRFRFGSAAEVEAWLRGAAAAEYGIAVEGMERLVISSYNFLARLQTSAAPLIAKCCGGKPGTAGAGGGAEECVGPVGRGGPAGAAGAP